MIDEKAEMGKFIGIFNEARTADNIAKLRKIQKEVKSLKLHYAFLCCLNTEINRRAMEISHIELEHDPMFYFDHNDEVQK